MWIMWTSSKHNFIATRFIPLSVGKQLILKNKIIMLCKHKNPQGYTTKNVDKHVDNVDNYRPKSSSPIFRTSPAPIVINKSPGIQFSNKNFSTSSKDGK